MKPGRDRVNQGAQEGHDCCGGQVVGKAGESCVNSQNGHNIKTAEQGGLACRSGAQILVLFSAV